MFAWYYEESNTQETGGDAWRLIDEAVTQAVDDGRLHSLRVGEMRDLRPSDFFDDEDVVALSDDGRLSAQEIVEVIADRASDLVFDGTARLVGADAKIALRRIVQRHRCAEDAAHEIVQWTNDHIELDPSQCCDGRDPLPIDYAEGKWRFGVRDESDPAMVITYAEEPSPETGHVGWAWWAQGRMGEAATLLDAMRAAEEALQRVIDDRMAIL